MKCSRCQNEDVQYFFENNGVFIVENVLLFLQRQLT